MSLSLELLVCEGERPPAVAGRAFRRAALRRAKEGRLAAQPPVFDLAAFPLAAAREKTNDALGVRPAGEAVVGGAGAGDTWTTFP
jgi:hypothetical protein